MTTIKLLVAVKSCNRHALEGYHQAIRDSWGQDVRPPAELRFFVGMPGDYTNWKPDETQVHEDDNYDELPRKTRAILRWFLERDYQYIFLCDTDTFVKPDELIRCGFETCDVAGRFGHHPEIGTTFEHRDDRGNYVPVCHPWPSGGVGYFLSRRAARYVVDTEPISWAEDFYVGQATGPYIQTGELTARDLPKFEANVAWHFPRKLHFGQVYNLQFKWQEKMWKEHK